MTLVTLGYFPYKTNGEVISVRVADIMGTQNFTIAFFFSAVSYNLFINVMSCGLPFLLCIPDILEREKPFSCALVSTGNAVHSEMFMYP